MDSITMRIISGSGFCPGKAAAAAGAGVSSIFSAGAAEVDSAASFGFGAAFGGTVGSGGGMDPFAFVPFGSPHVAGKFRYTDY